MRHPEQRWLSVKVEKPGYPTRVTLYYLKFSAQSEGGAVD